MRSQTSYAQIIRASAITGGAAAITLILSMVRVKAAAEIMGSGGVGLCAMFAAMQTFSCVIAGLGLNQSATRCIAIAASKQDNESIARVVVTLRRLLVATGLMAIIVFFLFSEVISCTLFGSPDHSYAIASFGLVIAFNSGSNAELALLQGFHHVRAIARANILSALVATAATVGIYIHAGTRGIVMAMVMQSAMQFIFLRITASRISLPTVRNTFTQTAFEARHLATLGVTMMINGLLVSGVNYATVLFITQAAGIEAVGLYSAAFGLSGIFVNFVLTAMATDYYPRLAAVASQNVKLIRRVNEQTEIATLLVLPGLVATLVFAPWILQVLYSPDFSKASPLLHWFVLGCLGRVVSWPLGFVVLALGKSRLFLITEMTFNLLHFALIRCFYPLYGLEGVAMAFSTLYFGYIAAVYFVCHRLIGFTWSTECRAVILFGGVSLGTSFVSCRYLSVWLSMSVGLLLMMLTAALCVRLLLQRVSASGGTERSSGAFLEEPKGRRVTKLQDAA